LLQLRFETGLPRGHVKSIRPQILPSRGRKIRLSV
jgi:hypothetical protein